MSTNLLRVEPNQRVDYTDFAYLLNDSLTAAMRDAANNFLLNPDAPAGERMRIIDGFEMDNPAGKQLRVTLGRALLAERIAGVAYYGALASTGDATQTIDMAPLASNTYGVYIRFEYVDAESGSRVFWNPGGSGSEFTQNVSTRRNAAWSIRVELVSPGAEWLQIGTADNSGGSLVLVDQRDLYFEGPVNSSYQSGWSTEGGGVANDRHADRNTHGVKDLQTFTAAMRQCLTDIRGRGLREWYETGIGGLNVGFDTNPTEGRINVGDEGFSFQYVSATDVLLRFDANDQLRYDRSNDHLNVRINSIEEARFQPEGLSIANGLYVGSVSEVPTDNDIRAQGDGYFAGGLHVGSPSSAAATGDGIFTRGVVVGYDGAPTDNAVTVVDADFGLFGSSSDPSLQFKKDGSLYSRIRFNRTNEFFYFEIDNTDRMQLYPTGLRINNGLYVGSVGTAATDNEIRCDGNLHVGGRQIYFGVGSNDYISHNDTNSEFYFVDDGTTEVKIGASGVNILNGLVVGNTSTVPTDNDIYCEGTIDCLGDLTAGSITMSGNIYTTGQIGRDSTDYIDWQGNDYMRFVTNNVEEMRLDADGLRIATGLFVGNTTGPATDNDIYAQGSIGCGTTIDASGDATFGTITMTGFSVDADGDVVGKTVRALNGPQLTATGITQAEVIAGASSIDGSGDLTMGTITMTGFSVDADGDTSMKTLLVANPSTANAMIGKFYDTRNSATKEFWIDYNADTSTGTEITVARMAFYQLEEILFGTASRCAFDLELTQYGSSPSTVFNVFRVGEFEGLCYNFGLAIDSQLSTENASVNWVLPNRHMCFSNTSSASAIDKEISMCVPSRVGPTEDPVSMINMDNSSSSNWVRIGGGMSGENGATAVSVYIATALNSTGSLAQSWSSSGQNACFDRYFYGVAGIQLNNDSSQGGSGTGRLKHSGGRLRFSPGPPVGDIHSTYRSIDSQQHYTSINVTKQYKYISPWIFNEDLSADGDCIYAMVSGHYTNGASSSMNIGLAYSPDHNAAPTTYQDLIFKGVNLDTAGRFIIEVWITCRTGGNARYVARIQDAGSNQRVEFLTTNIPWDHTKQKRFYLIGQAFGENRTIDLESGILGVS